MTWNDPAYDGRCRTDCKYWGGGTSGGSAAGTPSGSAPASRCFYSATWKRADGSRFGGSLSCIAPSKTDCREFTMSGPVIAPGDILEWQGGPRECDGPSSSTSSWSGGNTTGGYTGSMRNCIYLNASQNGRTFKASCEGDYYNCKDAATGARVENMGLSLGAPSECDGKPWSGGSGGGGMYGSAGDPGEACKRGCEEMIANQKTSPSCKEANPAPWCTQSLASCTASCGTGGGQGNTGGTQMPCTFPNGKVLYCRTPNVDCSATPGGPILSSQEVGATGPNCTFGGSQWSTGGGSGSDPAQCIARKCASMAVNSKEYVECKNWCYSGGDGGGGGTQGSMECMIDMCRGNPLCMAAAYTVKCDSKECMGNPDCRPYRSGGGGGGGGMGDETVECCAPVPPCTNNICPAVMPMCQRKARSQCQRDGWQITGEGRGGGGGWTGGGGGMDLWYQKNNIQTAINNLLWQIRELIDASKRNNVDVSAAVKSLQTGIQSAGACVEKADTQPAISACDDQRRSLDQTMQEIWGKIQAGSQNRRIAEMQEQFTHMNQFLQTATGDPQIIAYLNSQYGAAKSALGIAQNSTDDGSWQGVYDAIQAFWNAAQQMQYYGGGHEDDNRGRDFSEVCGHLKEEIARRGGDAGTAEQLTALVNECFSVMAKLSTGGAVSEKDVQSAMETIWRKFETLMSRAWGQDECVQAKNVIQEAEGAMSGEAQEMIAAVERTDTNGTVGKMNTLLNLGRSIVAKAKSAGSCKEALGYLSVMEEQVAQPFMALFQNSGVSMKKFKNAARIIDHRDDYAELSEEYFEDDVVKQKQITRSLEKKNYDSKELLILKKLSKESLEQAVGDDDVNIVNIAAELDIDDIQQIKELLQARDALKEEIKTLEEKRDGLKKDVLAMVETMQNYIPHPEYQDVMKELLQKAISGKVTGKQIEEEFRRAVEGPSQKEFVKEGTIAFEDVRLNDWSAKYANEAKKLGIIDGINGRFEGGRKTNGAEVMKMAAEMLGGADEDAEAESEFASKAPAWAKSAVATLEENGFDPDDVFGNPADVVTRKQAARMFAALFPLPEADEEVLEGYGDLDKLTEDEREAVAQMVAAGIMTGNGDKWDPNGAFNRDQFTKVAVLIMNLAADAATAPVADKEVGTAVPSQSTGTISTDSGVADTTHAAGGEQAEDQVPLPPPPVIPKEYPVSEQQLALIRARFEQFRSLPENSKLSTDREVMKHISLLRDTSVSLAGVQEFFNKMRKQENMPEVYIAKQLKDLKLQLTDEQFGALGDALGEW